MAYTPNTRNQLKNVTSAQIIRALKKDGWVERKKRAPRGFEKDGKYIVVHFHPGKTHQPKLIQKLLEKDAGWDEVDLKRLKLIK